MQKVFVFSVAASKMFGPQQLLDSLTHFSADAQGAIKQAHSPHPDPTSALNLDKPLSESCIVPLHRCCDNDSWLMEKQRT